MTAIPSVLAKVDDIPDRGVIEVSVERDSERESVLLLRAGDQVRAFHNICPHAGRPLNWAPGRFLVESGVLVCAAHGASFSIPEGRCVLGPCRGQSLSEVAVSVENGEVLLAAQ